MSFILTVERVCIIVLLITWMSGLQPSFAQQVYIESAIGTGFSREQASAAALYELNSRILQKFPSGVVNQFFSTVWEQRQPMSNIWTIKQQVAFQLPLVQPALIVPKAQIVNDGLGVRIGAPTAFRPPTRPIVPYTPTLPSSHPGATMGAPIPRQEPELGDWSFQNTDGGVHPINRTPAQAGGVSSTPFGTPFRASGNTEMTQTLSELPEPTFRKIVIGATENLMDDEVRRLGRGKIYRVDIYNTGSPVETAIHNLVGNGSSLQEALRDTNPYFHGKAPPQNGVHAESYWVYYHPSGTKQTISLGDMQSLRLHGVPSQNQYLPNQPTGMPNIRMQWTPYLTPEQIRNSIRHMVP